MKTLTQDKIKSLIKEAITAKALLLYEEGLINEIGDSAGLIIDALKKGGKVLICGNGGSAAGRPPPLTASSAQGSASRRSSSWRLKSSARWSASPERRSLPFPWPGASKKLKQSIWRSTKSRRCSSDENPNPG